VNIPSETLLCGCTAGVILVRPCPEPAAFTCARCGCPLCRKHVRPVRSGALSSVPAAGLCPACHAESGVDNSYAANREGDGWGGSSSGYHSGRSRNSDAFPVQNSEVDESLPADAVDEPFSSEDYAAFDAVSDYDKNADLSDGYDS
jgi:hypothetical protein